MKIGIVTMPLAINYGGILQNYALQQVLKGMGHNPITLNYMPSLSFGRYLLYVGKALVCAPFPSLRHPIKPYRHYIKRPLRIESFVQNNIVLTKTVPFYSKRLLKKYKIGAIVLGSDQVWRYRYNAHHIEDMYLRFAKDYPCNKIAYGASFGTGEWDYPEDKTLLVKELIKIFDAVSVRENSGEVMCREHLRIDAKIVIDPTLLLNASDYEVFCTRLDNEAEPYLASYVLDMTDEKNAYIEAFAKNKGLKVKRMTTSKYGVSIEEWLSTIRYADYVITDSYHGSLFSIIFCKQFQTIVNSERGADRFHTLFSELNLLKCLLYSVPKVLVKEEMIDYSQVQILLSNLRNDSLSFLYEYLK